MGGLIYHPEARVETVDAARYYENERSGLGREFLATIAQAEDEIAESPRRWARFDGPWRRRLLRRFPYAFIYRVDANRDLFVVAVMHLKRRPGYWKTRVRR